MNRQTLRAVVVAAGVKLEDHMRRYRSELLAEGTFANIEFDRLYLELIRARWDAEHAWVRSVWKERP